MPRLEDNSYASREARDRDRNRAPLERVTTGKVSIRKKTFGRKVLDMFLSEKIDDVGDYIRYNVIGPGIKSLIYDMFMSSLSMAFWGDARARGSRPGGSNGRTGYDRIYDERRSRDRGRRPAYDVEDIIFESREEAERVLDDLYDCLERYGSVRVADLYSSAGISPEGNFTVNNFGWRSLRGAGAYPTSEGWALDLPRAERL